MFQQREGEAWIPRARSIIRFVTGHDPQPSPELVTDFGHGYYDADPVAEAFVQDAYLDGDPRKARALVDRALTDGIASVRRQAPLSMRSLFAEIEQEPDWLDKDAVELGARVFRRWGPASFQFFGAITLEGYTENSVVKPLAFTGGYAGDRAYRRFLETVRFWIDTAEPGALGQGQPGRATAVKVRLMHVFVRRRLLAHPDWDLDAWGVPISQSDMLLTLLGGSVVPGYGLKLMGFRTSDEEIEALLHFQRYMGHLMGAQHRRYPSSVAEGLQYLFATGVKSCGRAGEDGRELIESYPRAFAPAPGLGGLARVQAEIDYRMALGYTRYFTAPKTFAKYDMPNAWPWALHPLLQAPGVFALETVRRHVGPVDALHDLVVRRRRKDWLKRRLPDDHVSFDAVRELRR